MEKGKQKNLLTMQEVNLHKLLPTLVLTNRFKGSGFNLLNYKVVPLLEYYYS